MKNFTRIVGTQRRRLCAIALVAVIGLSFTACGGGGGRAAPASDFTYALVNDADRESVANLPGELTISDGVKITGYTGNGGKVVIPATIEDIPVVMIEQRAFNAEQNNEPAAKITEVVIPEGVELILASAFYKCKNLTSVTLPASLKFIANFVFADCTELVNLTIPDSPSFTVYNLTFYNCEKLPLKTRQQLETLEREWEWE